MKLYRIILTVLLFTSISCKSKSKTKDCEDLKRGKFGFYGNNSDRKYIIERNDSTQIESDEDVGSVTEFYIRWPSSCEYELIFKRHIKVGKDTSILHRLYHPIMTSILEVGPDYYIFKSTVVGTSIQLTDTMGINKSL